MANVFVKVVDNSPLLKAELEQKIPTALEAVGLQAEGYAKLAMEGHNDTGLLRNSITHALGGYAPAIGTYSADKPKPNKKNSGSYSGTLPADEPNYDKVYIGTNVEYARYVELGTSRTDPVGFLKSAMSGHTNEYKKILQTFLK